MSARSTLDCLPLLSGCDAVREKRQALSTVLSLQQMSIVSMEATVILPILKKKLAFLSGRNAHSDVWDASYLCVVIWCLYWCVSRGEGSTQWPDPDHPAQLWSDQHGGAQHYPGLPAQHPQVNPTTYETLLKCQPCQNSLIVRSNLTHPLHLAVRSVRPVVSLSLWMDGSLSGTLWRQWYSCCRYKYLKTCNSDIEGRVMPGPDVRVFGLVTKMVIYGHLQ